MFVVNFCLGSEWALTLRSPAAPPSPALAAAQSRLLALRETYRARRAALGLAPVGDGAACEATDNGRFPPPPSPPPPPQPSALTLPPHLGWESAPLTAVLRRHLTQQTTNDTIEQVNEAAGSEPVCIPDTQPVAPPPSAISAPQTAVSICVYPDIALGILREEQAGPARIWYLLRHLDVIGCGWMAETAVRQHLTQRHSPLRICGGRQLRNLLNQGEGLFWVRHNGRIWLRSLVKVAVALSVKRLQGRPVAVDLAHFTHGIGTFRAHLYATFHSGRGSDEKMAAPIARETVANLSHVPPRTQRLYEAKSGVKKSRNFALGTPVSPKQAQETGWQKGQALFLLTDRRGYHGPAGETYLAWQLPNSYSGPHPQQSNGRQKRLNQAIADLLPIGMTGNGNSQTEPQRQRRYCHHGKMAAQLYNRLSDAFYWPALKSNGFWYVTQNN